MNGCAHVGSGYTDEQRREVVAQFAVYGNNTKVHQLTGVPVTTISHWRNHTDWWGPELERVRTENQDEIDASITRIIQKATSEIEDRIKNGDEVLDKSGDLIRKKVGARDLATVGGIMFDKRQILRNQPTSIRAESTDARLDSLAAKIRGLQAGGDNVIEGEVVAK